MELLKAIINNCNNNPFASYTLLPNFVNIHSFSVRRILIKRKLNTVDPCYDATMLYKIVNGLAPPYLECYVNKRSTIHSYNTRSRNNLVVPFGRTAIAQRSFSYRTITAWNSFISEETKNSATLSVFKRAVKRAIYTCNSP